MRDNNKGWKDQRINAVYQEMAEHYGTAIEGVKFSVSMGKILL